MAKQRAIGETPVRLSNHWIQAMSRMTRALFSRSPPYEILPSQKLHAYLAVIAVWFTTSWVCTYLTQKPPNCLRAGHAFLDEAREDCDDRS
jgi:hypothetical protein